MTAALGRRLLILGVRPQRKAYRKTSQDCDGYLTKTFNQHQFMTALAPAAAKLAGV
ncbi:MAG: hypothetical protein IH818_08965 [Acidobacteria bacterium]|nr:hypothetical protein [Acidobacteriota bacterium]